MIFVDCLGVTVWYPFIVELQIVCNQTVDIFIQVTLVLFDRQDVIPTLLDNRFGNLGLSADSIHHDDTAFDFQ